MSWGAIGAAAVGVVGSALTADDGGGGSYPAPSSTASAQGDENRRTFQYQLDASRIGSSNPFGRSTWRNNAVFDQTGYDRAMAEYNARPNSPAPAPQTPVYGHGEDQFNVLGFSAQPPAAPASVAPDRAAFQGPAQWENVQSLAPSSQGVFDTATQGLGQAVKNIPTSADAYSQSTADAIFRRTRRYQDPLDEQARVRQQSDLADRGFQLGNAATTAERTRLDDSISRGVADSADRAQIAGFSQGQQQLSMQQQIANTLQSIRGQQVNGISGLSSTSSTPGLNPVDLTALTSGQYVDSVNRANADAAGNQQLWSGLSGLIQPLLDSGKNSNSSGSFGATLDDFFRGTRGSGD